jgi:hypothetical protein
VAQAILKRAILLPASQVLGLQEYATNFLILAASTLVSIVITDLLPVDISPLLFSLLLL